MDDKTLLELAAKAAGLKGKWIDTEYEHCFKVPYAKENMRGWKEWNPLTDDGDCARLESASEISIEWHDDCVISTPPIYSMQVKSYFSNYAQDKNKARRWASVRAAAKIGKSL